MSKERTPWSKILGLHGVKIYRDKTKWGFWLKIEKSCTKSEVDNMVGKLKAEGFNAQYYFHLEDKFFGCGVIKVDCDALTVAKNKLTAEEYDLIKTEIISLGH